MHEGHTSGPHRSASVRAGRWRGWGLEKKGLLQKFDITHNQLLPVNKNHSNLFFCQQLRLHQGFLKDLQVQKMKQFRKQTVSSKLARTRAHGAVWSRGRDLGVCDGLEGPPSCGVLRQMGGAPGGSAVFTEKGGL